MRIFRRSRWFRWCLLKQSWGLAQTPSFSRFALVATGGWGRGGWWRSSSDYEGGSPTPPKSQSGLARGAQQAPPGAQTQTCPRTCRRLSLYPRSKHNPRPCKGCKMFCKYLMVGGVIRMPHVCEEKWGTHARAESRQEDIGEGGRKGKCSLEWRLKLSAVIYKLVNASVAHSLSRRSKHRKMLLISVCDAEAPLESLKSSSARANRLAFSMGGFPSALWENGALGFIWKALCF